MGVLASTLLSNEKSIEKQIKTNVLSQLRGKRKVHLEVIYKMAASFFINVRTRIDIVSNCSF